MPGNRVGSIRRRGEGWSIAVQRGKKPDGSPRTVYETVHGTRRDAEIRAAMIARDMGRTAAAGDSMTLREYFEEVFPKKPSVRGTLRCNATMKGYRDGMRHALEVIGDKPLNSLRHAEIAAAVQSSPSPKNAKAYLRAVLRSAYDDELMDERPFDRRVPTHRERREQAQPWTRFEVAEFFAKLDRTPMDPSEDRDSLEIYAILGLCGLSRSEALGVRSMDIREETAYSFATGEEVRTMTVTVAMTYTDADGFKPWAKNDHRCRTVPVPPVFRERLRRLLSVSRARAADPSAWAASRLVDRRGDNLVTAWRRLLKRLGMRYIPPNMLRHTTDTLAITAGVSGDLNDKMHGRSDHASTYAHYFRPDLGAMDDAARLISDAIEGGEG